MRMYMNELLILFGVAQAGIMLYMWRTHLLQMRRLALKEDSPHLRGGRYKLSREKRIEIAARYGTGRYTQRQLGQMYNVSTATICHILQSELR